MPGLIRPDGIKFVPKRWGWEQWIVNNEHYCGKILFIEKGKYCSFHFHKIKDEVLYVQSGKIAMFTDKIEIMTPGFAWHMTPEVPHQMYAIEDTIIHEFSTHHEDSDSYRVSTDLQFTLEELCNLVHLETNGSNKLE